MICSANKRERTRLIYPQMDANERKFNVLFSVSRNLSEEWYFKMLMINYCFH